MNITKSVEHLPCQLTGEELILKAKQLAQLAVEIGVLEEEKKTHAADIKAKIESKETAQHVLVREVHTGIEERPIECVTRPRYSDGMVDTLRTDTGAVISSRPMHPSERQAALDLGDLVEAQNVRPIRGGAKKGTKLQQTPTSARGDEIGQVTQGGKKKGEGEPAESEPAESDDEQTDGSSEPH